MDTKGETPLAQSGKKPSAMPSKTLAQIIVAVIVALIPLLGVWLAQREENARLERQIGATRTAEAIGTAYVRTCLAATETSTCTLTMAPTEVPSRTPCPTVSGPFAQVWEAFQSTMGCARGPVHTGGIVEESFRGGKMFWRDAFELEIVVLFDDDQTWRIFDHTPFTSGTPEFSCPDEHTQERCPPTPMRGFGLVWCRENEVRQRLGDAIDCERSYAGDMQQFDGGFMLKRDDGVIYILSADDRRWEAR